MAQDIKQRISLEGEKEYNAALKDAQRHLKTLRSELKAETAELGANATAQEKNRVKSQNLQKQIKEQEQVVKTLREALEQAKKEYGDNEEVVAKWEQKLNDARTTLANMQNDMQRMSNDIRQVNTATAEGVTATKSFADAIDKIGSAGGGIADALESTFTTVVDVIKDAIGELWGLIADTAKKANEWTDIAAIWNTDPNKIQKYARGVEYAGKSFSDLNTAVNKIVMGDRKKILMLTGQSLGGDGDEWQYAMDVLNAIAHIENHAKQLDVIGEIFGDKKAAGILDLVNEWDRIQEGGEKLTEGGYGLGDHELEVLNSIAMKISEVEASWNALKEHMAGLLAEATLPIIVDVQGAIDGLAEYMAAETPEEQQEALKKIEGNITKFCEDVAKALEAGLEIIGKVGEGLSESDNVVAKAVGNALLVLKKTLEWLMDEKNWGTIKQALEGFFLLWTAGKGATALAKIAALAANIKTITAFKSLNSIKNFLSGGGGGGENTNTGGAPTNTTTQTATQAASGAAGGGMFTGLRVMGNRIATGALNLSGYIGNSAGPYMDWFLHQTDVGRWIMGQETLEEVQQAIVDYGDSVKKNAETFGEDWAKNPITQFFKTGFETNGKNAMALWNSIFGGESLPEAVAEVIEDELLDDDTGLLLSPRDRQAVEDYWDAIRDDDGEGTDAANAYLKLWEHFSGNADDLAVFNKITEMIDGLKEFGSMDADLPSWWFSEMPQSGGDGGLTSEDISGFKGLPGQITAAARTGVQNGISNVKVYMDGVAVGHLVAATVSQDIAFNVV